MLHPKIHMPIWVAVAIVAAAVGLRVLLHGASFSRTDALVLGLLAVVLLVVGLTRRSLARESSADVEEPTGE